MIRMKWGDEKKFYLWIGFSLLLLAVIVGLSYFTAHRLINYDTRVKRSNETLLRLEQIFSNIKVLEISVSNYVITGRASYLLVIDGVKTLIDQDINQVHKLLSDDPDLEQKLKILGSLISERFSLFDHIADLREDFGFEAAQQFIMTGKGEKVNNKTRQVIDEIETKENELLGTLLNEKGDAKNMIYVTASGIIIAIVFAALSIFTINRHIRERKLLYENSKKQSEELRILYEDQNQRSRDLEILRNMSQIIHKSLSLEDVYNIALDSIMSFENVDIAMIYLIDENTNEAVLVGHRNVPENYLSEATRIPYSKGITWTLIESGEISYIEDVQSHPYLAFAHRELVFQSALGIPFIHEEKTLGAVRILSSKKRAFDGREVNLLSTLCNQIALALAKATIFKALEGAHEKLMELDTLKDDFISIASHELRTPLGAIGGYLDMLLEGDFGVLSPKVMFAITEVNKATKRLTDLVNEMLDISRIEQGRLEINNSIFDLCNVYAEVIQSFRPAAEEKGIRLEYMPPTGTDKLFVFADKDRVQQILINLIGNAIKFTETGEVVITYRFDDSKVVTEVVDTGVGIPTDTRERLFQKFWKGRKALTRRSQEGTGLGLYICRLLIQAMGGDIWLERSESGAGSTFSFSLPRPESIII
jgi:signal transduction histidine kinase/CHASE3 domain sensor protein